MATIRKVDRDFWLRFRHRLQVEVPLPRPANVRTRQLAVDFGSSWYFTQERRFKIVIASRLNFDLRAETLCHEWAHCHDWFTRREKDILRGVERWADQKRIHIEHADDHGPTWGMSYSLCYRALERLIKEYEERQ